MKSSICSSRTIRKFFLVGAVLLSTCTLQSSIVFATCVLQKTNPAQTRLSIKLQNATLEEFVKQVEQKTGYRFIYGEEVRLNGREEKQTYAQVAEELGISTKTVDAQLQKATIRLKEMLLQ